jgi:hypothetical protein
MGKWTCTGFAVRCGGRGGLLLLGRIPPACVVDDVVRDRDIEADADYTSRQNKHVEARQQTPEFVIAFEQARNENKYYSDQLHLFDDPDVPRQAKLELERQLRDRVREELTMPASESHFPRFWSC